MLTRAEIMIINDMVSKIYSIDDFDAMRLLVLKEINDLIPYDSASFYMASKTDDHILARPVGIGISESELQRYIDYYEDKDYTRWIFMSTNNMVYRESDLFPDSRRENEEYYQAIYLNGNIYYSAQASISTSGLFQGVISLYRDRDKEDFSDRELFMLELLLIHFENRISSEIKKDALSTKKSRTHFQTYELMQKYGLTRREVEILGLLLAGLAGEMIADKLAITPNTLKKHCTSIYKKLGINSRWELIKFTID